jgi:hypothetical protein
MGNSPNQLLPGDVFVVHTNANHYAKVLVKTEESADLTIQWITYKEARRLGRK